MGNTVAVKKKNETSKVGEMRPSQILHTFGVGAIVDLPNISAMVMGLDDWPAVGADEIGEVRLLAAVQQSLGPQVKRLLAPPRQIESAVPDPFATATDTGVPVATFPRWMVCLFCHLLAPLDSGLFQLKRDQYRPDRTKYVHGNCMKRGQPPTAVPARFLVACEHGHLDEFPWHFFVHEGASDCVGRMRLVQSGGIGDVTAVQVRCDGCDARRQMSDAFGDSGKESLPQCRGRHPHLRQFADDPCPQPLKTILLGASNSWFGVTLTALSVPVAEDPLGRLVDGHWHLLDKVKDISGIELLRSIGQLSHFHLYTDEAIWHAAERKRLGNETAEEQEDLKAPEWRVFTNPHAAPEQRDFKLREVQPPDGYAHLISRVVLVERVREVSSLIGFTRIASTGEFADTTIELDARSAPLCRGRPSWVPTAEVHGEGVFLQFDEAALIDWLDRHPDIAAHDRRFRMAHRQWRTAHHITPPEEHYPGLRYVLLHTFSHALMRQLTIECGYSMASIRERIYALGPEDDGGPMAGVLLYTAAADSEGTLGGLVSLGQPEELGRHIVGALEQMKLCASDPHCAEHEVGTESTALHGACCHACLFVPETSCERGNKYLDRTLLVPTIHRGTLAFFEASS